MFFDHPSNNLQVLVRNRYEWMNAFIEPDDRGVELGSGAGLSRPFIRAREFLLTDFSDHEWLDVKQVDAQHTPFPDAGFDFVIGVNMIHHLAHPLGFFAEARRDSEAGRPPDRAGREQHAPVPARAADAASRRLRLQRVGVRRARDLHRSRRSVGGQQRDHGPAAGGRGALQPRRCRTSARSITASASS